MSEKLNLKELSVLLSQRSNLSQVEAEAFLQELFNVISGSLSESDQVSIKDLGTFKLSSEQKKERLIGDTLQHKEIDFLPDKELEELVNKPFSHFEPTQINDGVEFDDLNITGENEIIEESIDIEKDIAETENEKIPALPLTAEIPPVVVPHFESEMPETNDVVNEESESVKVKEERQVHTDENLVEVEKTPIEEPTDESTHESPSDQDQLDIAETTKEPEIERLFDRSSEERSRTSEPVKPFIQTYDRKDITEHKKEKSKTRNIIIATSLIGVLVLVVIIFLIIKLLGFDVDPAKKVEYINLSPIDSVYNEKATTDYLLSDSALYPSTSINADSNISAVETTPIPASPATSPSATVSKELVVTPVDKKTEEVKTVQQPVSQPKAVSEQKVVELKAGETLRDVAFRTLGHREFWVYIYLKNQNRIKDPNVVPAGSQLALPDDTEFNLDPKDPYAIADARDMGYEVIRKFQ